MSELVPQQLIDGKYEVVRLIGGGAWATVYEAVNKRIQRRVAIKLLNADLAQNDELRTRFHREAEAATQIDSPFVMGMYDAGQLEDGRPYLVMEYLEGEDLAERIRVSAPLPEGEVATFALHLLSGLADAHEVGVLHRDIKPDNLVIVKARGSSDELLKIVDFGMSKPTVGRPESLGLTQVDSVVGSPVYMSPEQARGTRHMDHRSDVYSVGVVLFESLTKTVPHDADTFNDLMFKIALEDAPNIKNIRPNLDGELAGMVMKAINRDPAARFQSAAEFRDAIAAWLRRRGLIQSGSRAAMPSERRLIPPDSGRQTGNNDKIESPLKPQDLSASARWQETTTSKKKRDPRLFFALGAMATLLILGVAGISVSLSARERRPAPAALVPDPPAPSPAIASAAGLAPIATATAVTTLTDIGSAAPVASAVASAVASGGSARMPAPAVVVPGKGPPPRGPTPKAPVTTAASAGSPAPSSRPAPASTIVDGRVIHETF